MAEGSRLNIFVYGAGIVIVLVVLIFVFRGIFFNKEGSSAATSTPMIKDTSNTQVILTPQESKAKQAQVSGLTASNKRQTLTPAQAAAKEAALNSLYNK